MTTFLLTLLYISIIVLSGFIIWRATDGFELASDYLGRNLSKGVKGATINAIASSMPEFLATFFFLFYLKDSNGFSGGIGIAGGSAIFNILIIPFCIFFAVYFMKRGAIIMIERTTILRDGIVLLVMTGLMAVLLHSRELKPVHGIILTFPYFIYLIILFRSQKDLLNVHDEFVFKCFKRKVSVKDFLLLSLGKLVLRERRITGFSAWKLLAVSSIVMMAGTWMLVYATDRLGAVLDIPLIFISVVLAAAASSIPDTMISIRDAKKGNYEDAFSNALGSNIFNISFALGFPLLLYTIIFQPITMDEKVIEAATDIWFLLFVISTLTIIVFVAGKRFSLPKAMALIILYLVFMGFVVVEMLYDVNLTAWLFF
jgi:Ca2+/Na+ antiporter